MNSLAALLHRYTQWGPHVSEKRREYAEQALKDVDFSRPEAIVAALGDIIQMGRMDRFCDRVFHGNRKTVSLLIFSILSLHNQAKAREFSGAVTQLNECLEQLFRGTLKETPVSVQESLAKLVQLTQAGGEGTHPSREALVSTLAQWLGASGKADLLRSIEEPGVTNEFTLFLSDQDRWSLAYTVATAQGSECRSQGDEYARQGKERLADVANTEARKALKTAAWAREYTAINYTLEGQYALAATAYRQRADALEGAGEDMKDALARTYLRAGYNHAKAGLNAQAIADYVKAEKLYRKLEKPEDVAVCLFAINELEVSSKRILAPPRRSQ
ncbi:hypothetical protein AB870_24880 (plasmid) [Pandoraea faecigallinarum]|uniref:Tetratricopeptide repeat protein n=1 Tax=Pandoraea faecigallinarum TaxID=656179 RepID=A0A0H3X0L8_9BURK|nr:hypothetical protein [Pandoraea faecigallinarum]AKM33415.1 hypothetical protein AB870_24880 [Pandoraea faecigallinarum]